MIGRLIDNRYRVRARIARGGMATVYVATDLRLERRVAIKVMHGHLADDTVFQSRFIQEARAAARLADPHVVNVFDQGQDGDMAYLVMEYLPGITLRELLREQKRLSVPQTITIMDAVLSGLASAHRAGIVHRDVKPENVLLAEDGRIKIGDFGLARATSANTATGQMLLGTIAYLAPELVTRGTADARSDIYALGIMLYEMLAGEQPYKGEQPMQIAYQHATDSVPRPSAKNPGVPEQLDELVLWATEREPDQRPENARVMLDRLREIEAQLGVHPQVVRTTPIGGGIVGDDLGDSGELTKVMPGTFTAPVVTTETDHATRLRGRMRRRAVKGGWLFTLVLLLALLAGGAGWWYGSGPGSLVAIPDVTGLTAEQAAAELAERGLVAVPGEENSLDVPPGTVIRTDPDIGVRLDKNATVTVIASIGPATRQIPELWGTQRDRVVSLLEEIHITIPGEDSVYFSNTERGSVIGAWIVPAEGDSYNCTNGCSALEGSTAELETSLGPLPSVEGSTAEEAADALGQVGVSTEVAEEYSDDVEKGRVIRVADRADGGLFRPGDTVTVVVSLGPELFAVPDVLGESVADAIQILRDAGFEPGTAVPEIVWSLFSVSSTNPAPGELVPLGTSILIRAIG
ncbi:serine/threonine protein kinase [Microbacterium sp. No. 7]|nr:serine/threonine protein kinase [Microbacterium sp. No. 7]